MSISSASTEVVLSNFTEAYDEWESLDSNGREELNFCLRSPSSELWLNVCKKAVDHSDANWLRRFADCETADDLPWPFDGWAAIPILTKKKFLALSLANGAIAAMELRCRNATKAISYAERAVFFKRKSIHQSVSLILSDASSLDKALGELAKTDLFSESLEVKQIINFLASSSNRLSYEGYDAGRARFPVVVNNIHGRICEFQVRRLENGQGQLFRDPFSMSSVPFGEELLTAVHDAFGWTKAQYGIPPNLDFCWRIFDQSRQLESFGGPSIGLAAAVALRQSVIRPTSTVASWVQFIPKTLLKRFRINYAFTGALDAKTGNLTPVAGYLQKIETLDRTYTLFVPDGEFGDLTEFIEDNHDVRPAKSLLQVVDQTRTLFPRRVKAGFMSAILLLLLAIGGLYWAHIQGLRAAAAVDRADAEENAKLAAESNSAAEKKLADAAREALRAETEKAAADELMRQNAETERDIARREKFLALQQSAALRAKNAELDLAQKNEAAQRQKAEVNEKKAAASEQVAVASRFAAEGYRKLVEDDKTAAQTYFARAIELDDQQTYRSGFLQASFDAGAGSYRLAWHGEGVTATCSDNCGISALDNSGELFATISPSGKSVDVIRTSDGTRIYEQPLDTCIGALAISHSSNRISLAMKTCSGPTNVIDATSGQLIRHLESDEDSAFFDSLNFSPDSTQLALVSGPCSIDLYRTADWSLIRRIDCGKALEPDQHPQVSAIAFGPNGLFAYALNAGPFFIESIDGKIKRRVDNFATHFKIGFTGSGDLILADDTITIFPRIADALSSYGIPKYKRLKPGIRPNILFASNLSQPYFVWGGDSGTLQIRRQDELIQRIGFNIGKTLRLFFGSNGRIIAQTMNGNVFCWESTAPNFRKYEDYDSAQTMELKGKSRYTSVAGESFLVQDSEMDKTVFTLPLKEAANGSAFLSPDGSRVFVNGDPIVVYDIEAKKRIFEFTITGSHTYLAGSNGNDKIAVVGDDSTRIISIPQNRVVGEISNSASAPLIDIEFSPKDTFLVGQTPNGINLINARDGTLAHFIPFSPEPCPLDAKKSCSSAVISPSEEYVAICHLSGRVELWSLDMYRHLQEVVLNGGDESPERVSGIGFSSDSRMVFWTSLGSGRLHFFDIGTHKMLPDFPTGRLLAGVESQEGKFLFADGRDGVFVTEEDTILRMLTNSAQSISEQARSTTGLTITGEKPKFSQRELSQLVDPSRFDTDLIAFPLTGTAIAEAKEFSGLHPGIAIPNGNGGAQCAAPILVPVFNAYTPTFSEKPAFCSDYSPIDIARDMPNIKWSASWIDWKKTREYHDGDRLIAGIYINNGAANNLDPESTTAKNVVISTALEKIAGSSVDGAVSTTSAFYKISVGFSAENAAPLNASVFVETGADEYLEIVPNSGAVFDYQGRAITQLRNIDLGNGDYLLGKLGPNWEDSLFLTYKIVVKKRT